MLAVIPYINSRALKWGRQGIEKRFEEELRGEAGTRRVEVNAVGREIRELPPRQEALKGQDLHLTLDMALQQYTLDQLGRRNPQALW